MARAELIGLMDCPECGFKEAEVRPDKSGSPYRFCPDCTAQYFSRGGEKAKALMAKVRRTDAPPLAQQAAVDVLDAHLPKGVSETSKTTPPASPTPPAKKKSEGLSWMQN